MQGDHYIFRPIARCIPAPNYDCAQVNKIDLYWYICVP